MLHPSTFGPDAPGLGAPLNLAVTYAVATAGLVLAVIVTGSSQHQIGCSFQPPTRPAFAILGPRARV